MFAGPPGTALLTSRSADGAVVPMPMLPLGATKNLDVPPSMKLIDRWPARAIGDVVDAVFVGDVVEPLELAERAVLVVEEHAGVGRGGVAEILDGQTGERAVGVGEADVEVVEGGGRADADLPPFSKMAEGPTSPASTYLARKLGVPGSSPAGAAMSEFAGAGGRSR